MLKMNHGTPAPPPFYMLLTLIITITPRCSVQPNNARRVHRFWAQGGPNDNATISRLVDHKSAAQQDATAYRTNLFTRRGALTTTRLDHTLLITARPHDGTRRRTSSPSSERGALTTKRLALTSCITKRPTKTDHVLPDVQHTLKHSCAHVLMHISIAIIIISGSRHARRTASADCGCWDI